MNILVDIPGDRRIARALARAGYDVHAVASPKIETAFVGIADVPRLRDLARRIYVIAVLDAVPSPNDFWIAYQAGADDVMRIDASDEEIVGRAGALTRIHGWTRPPLAERIERLASLLAVDTIVGTELGDMLGAPFQPSAATLGPIACASDIALTFAAEYLQIRIGLAVDAIGQAQLQTLLLGGDRSPEAIADAMRELANTAGGAIKRAALECGVDLTIGLPTNTNIVSADPPGHRAWQLETAEGLVLACAALSSSTVPRLVVTRDLREGMILARDVRTPRGDVIACAGTNLTQTTVAALAGLLDAKTTLEISSLAA